MADTIQNIKLTANTWINLYAASGITVGVQIVIENLTTLPVKHHAGTTVPTDAEKDNETGSFQRIMAYDEKVNDLGDAGAWAYSSVADGLVNVKVF
tara:strand:+ start:277 stop:564 length:288 start_codon:yes stop_codon:yes gene_type:complete